MTDGHQVQQRPLPAAVESRERPVLPTGALRRTGRLALLPLRHAARTAAAASWRRPRLPGCRPGPATRPGIPGGGVAAGAAATLLIGAAAGLLPAIRAARLSPTQALWSI
jgi:hypothetical protein